MPPFDPTFFATVAQNVMAPRVKPQQQQGGIDKTALLQTVIGGGLNAAGAGMQAAAQGKMSQQDRQFAAAQAGANQGNLQQSQDLARASAYNSQLPFGSDLQFYQKQKGMQAMLPHFRNFSLDGVPAEVAAKMPKQTSGFDAAGFAKSLMDSGAYSDEAIGQGMENSYKRLSALDPTISSPQLGFIGGNSQGIMDTIDLERKKHGDMLQTNRDEVQRSIEEMKALAAQKQKGSGGGFWKTLGKIGLLTGGGIATALSGGTLAPLLIGAGTGAGAGAIDGGWKGALLGGASGAGSAAVAKSSALTRALKGKG